MPGGGRLNFLATTPTLPNRPSEAFRCIVFRKVDEVPSFAPPENLIHTITEAGQVGGKVRAQYFASSSVLPQGCCPC